MYKCISLVFFVLSCPQTDSARILGVFPTPSISHQIVFRALYSELVKKGHELVVITTDPIYRNKTAPENLTEIDIGFFYEIMTDRNDPMWKSLKRGVIMEAKDWMFVEPNPFLQKNAELLNSTEISKLIKDKSNKFDLILFEPLTYLPLVLSHIFEAPAIMISSFYGFPENYATVGAVSRHPILYPHIMRDKFKNLNLFEKIYEMHREYEFYKLELRLEKEIDKYLRQLFGSVPPLRELKKSYVQLFFVNSHPLFDGNRPVPPGVVYLGGMHLQPMKALPEDLKSYLENSKRGVIYVSFGTNVRTQNMDSEMVNAFLDAFKALPYDILWKFDTDLDIIPKNVRIQKWFPQRDLLGHPNIKLFITQGGRQSTDEAIDAGVPLVGIPFYADQWYSVEKYVELGIGVKVNALTITASDIIKAANTVLSDASYRKNIRKLSQIIKDQKETPIERAVWWTEYVLRHKESRHLLSPAADMTWSEYLMADVVIVLAIILFIVSLTALVILYYVVSLILFASEIVKVKKD